MTRTIDRLASYRWPGDWRPIMEFRGARFFQASDDAGLYMRQRRRDDGSTEVRYAWDGSDVVFATLGDLAAAIDRGAT